MRDVDSCTGQSPVSVRYTTREVRLALRRCIIAWIFGSSFFAITTGAVFSSFLTKYLHTDDATYGLIMSIGSIGMLFQLFGSYVVERTGRTKRTFLFLVTAHRLIWLGIAAIPLCFPVIHGQPAILQIWLVICIVFISAVAANYGGAGWTTWMSDIVPKQLAGAFFGIRARLGMLSMVLVAWGTASLLDSYHGVGWIYAVVFGIAALLGAMDIVMFIPVREIPRQIDEQPPRALDIITIPWHDDMFRRFASYTGLSWISYMMMGPFTWRFCFDDAAAHGLAMSVSMVNFLLYTLPMIAMAWVAPFWGKAIDRYGPKPVLAASSVFQIFIPLCWLMVHPGTTWLIPMLAVISGFTWPGIDQVNFYMQLKGFPSVKRTAYIAMFLMVFGLACTCGTLLGGYCATFWQQHLQLIPGLPASTSHYHLVFATAIVLRVVAYIFMLPNLPLPGSLAKKGVANTVIAGMTNSLSGMVRKLPRVRIPLLGSHETELSETQ